MEENSNICCAADNHDERKNISLRHANNYRSVGATGAASYCPHILLKITTATPHSTNFSVVPNFVVSTGNCNPKFHFPTPFQRFKAIIEDVHPHQGPPLVLPYDDIHILAGKGFNWTWIHPPAHIIQKALPSGIYAVDFEDDWEYDTVRHSVMQIRDPLFAILRAFLPISTP